MDVDIEETTATTVNIQYHKQKHTNILIIFLFAIPINRKTRHHRKHQLPKEVLQFLRKGMFSTILFNSLIEM